MRLLEDLAAGHLEDDVDRLAELASTRRSQALGRGVDRGVGAELERQVALLLASTRRRSRGPAPSGLPSWTASEPTPPAAAMHDDALARLHARARLVEVPGGQALEQQRQRRAVVDAVGDRERQRAPARSRTRRSRRRRTARRRARRCPRARPRPPRRAPAAASPSPGRCSCAGGCRRSSAPRADLDQHLAVGRLGHRQVDELEHLGPAELLHLDRAHRRREHMLAGMDLRRRAVDPADPVRRGAAAAREPSPASPSRYGPRVHPALHEAGLPPSELWDALAAEGLPRA